jgi:hypothetical protein
VILDIGPVDNPVDIVDKPRITRELFTNAGGHTARREDNDAHPG